MGPGPFLLDPPRARPAPPGDAAPRCAGAAARRGTGAAGGRAALSPLAPAWEGPGLSVRPPVLPSGHLGRGALLALSRGGGDTPRGTGHGTPTPLSAQGKQGDDPLVCTGKIRCRPLGLRWGNRTPTPWFAQGDCKMGRRPLVLCRASRTLTLWFARGN